METRNRGEIVLELFDRYYERVFRFVRRSLDQSSAEDIVQDVFARLLSTSDLESKDISASYLIKIADNLMKRRYQQAVRRTRLAQHQRDEVSARGAGSSSPTDRLEAEEQRDFLKTASMSLAPHEQDALRMIVSEGVSYQAAAASLGVRVTSVNNWKYRGLQRLKDQRLSAGRVEDGANKRSERAGGVEARVRAKHVRVEDTNPADAGRDRLGQRAG